MTGIQRHETSADDLSYIGSGIDAQGQYTDTGIIPAGTENDKAHNEQLHQHGSAPNDGDIDFANKINNTQDGIIFSGTLLVMCGTDYGYDNTQCDANQQGQCGNHQCAADTL